jgi:hypothetical protein
MRPEGPAFSVKSKPAHVVRSARGSLGRILNRCRHSREETPYTSDAANFCICPAAIRRAATRVALRLGAELAAGRVRSECKWRSALLHRHEFPEPDETPQHSQRAITQQRSARLTAAMVLLLAACSSIVRRGAGLEPVRP